MATGEKKTTAAKPARKQLTHPIKSIKVIMDNWVENRVISDYQAFNLYAMVNAKANTLKEPEKIISCVHGAGVINSLAMKYSLVKIDAIHESFIKNIQALGESTSK